MASELYPAQRGLPALCLSALLFALGACGPAIPVLTRTNPACPALSGLSAPLTWIAPTGARELERSRRWCEGTGPVVVRHEAPLRGAGAGDLFVVSWNVAVGRGQVHRLLRHIRDAEQRAGRSEPGFVLLLQEAFHGASGSRGPDGPAEPDAAGANAGARRQHDIERLSAQLGMNAVYVPSMRHRGRGAPAANRGNAILSTLPLEDITAVELPFVRQRRVAVAATVLNDGARLTVMSVHLDTRRRFAAGSIFSGPFGRARQAEAIVHALELMRTAGPIIIGGDLNTVAGLREPAIRALEQHFVRLECGSSLTHRWGYPLDHLFASDASIVGRCERSRMRYGSDHHPLVARVIRGPRLGPR